VAAWLRSQDTPEKQGERKGGRAVVGIEMRRATESRKKAGWQ